MPASRACVCVCAQSTAACISPGVCAALQGPDCVDSACVVRPQKGAVCGLQQSHKIGDGKRAYATAVGLFNQCSAGYVVVYNPLSNGQSVFASPRPAASSCANPLVIVPDSVSSIISAVLNQHGSAQGVYIQHPAFFQPGKSLTSPLSRGQCTYVTVLAGAYSTQTPCPPPTSLPCVLNNLKPSILLWTWVCCL